MWPSKQFASKGSFDAAAFSPEVKWPTLRVVIDPQAEVPEAVDTLLDTLRTSDTHMRIFRRVDGPALASVGDYEVIPPGPETGGEYAGVLRSSVRAARRAVRDKGTLPGILASSTPSPRPTTGESRHDGVLCFGLCHRFGSTAEGR